MDACYTPGSLTVVVHMSVDGSDEIFYGFDLCGFRASKVDAFFF